ncbi:MAG: hypothetical protein H6907_02365 [Hyphomicrobiales bacterium]|nr:hypothetical protein [Hyphomicrobiales bacterium]
MADSTARLFLSTVTADFDAARDAALGPWCFAGAERVYEEWENLPFFDPFENAAVYAEHARNVGDLAMIQADRLGRRLNARHGTSYDRHHWRLILVPWLSALIQASWIRFAHLQKFIRANGNRAFTVEVCDDLNPWAFRDTEDFVDFGVPNPGFNAWMLSVMVRRLAPDTWRLVPIQAQHREAPPSPAGGEQRGWKRDLLPDRLSVDNVPGLRWGKLLFSVYVNCLPRRRGGEPAYEPDPGSCLSAFPDVYLEILDRLVAATEPCSYGQDFAILDNQAKEKRYRPGRLLVGFVELFNERERFIAAHARSNGERLVIVQHGGGYGAKKCDPDGNNFEYRQFAFVTWGWTEVEGSRGRFVPLPAPHLSRIRNRHRRTTNDLVLVGTQMQLFPRWLHAGPQSVQTLAYRREKIGFVEALAEPARQRLRYRPYFRSEVDLEDEQFLRRQVGDLDLVTGDLHRHLLNCRMAVIDHPITTLPVALAANVPTVAFWDDTIWPRSPQAAASLEVLADCGILHRSGRSAGAQVNAVWDDVESWWRDRPVQRARQQWCHQYARTHPFWWAFWLAGLWRLASAHGRRP